MTGLPGEQVKNKVQEILQECYVFDTKDYDRSIKVPRNPDDRWDPYFRKKYLDYPVVERMTRNIFTSVLSYALKHSKRKTFTTFDSPVQAIFERDNDNSILLRQDNCVNFMTEAPLKPVSAMNDVKSTESHEFADFYPLKPLLDFKLTDLYHPYESFGVSSSEVKAKFFPHTSFLPATTKRADQMQYAVCLFAFANAVAKARQIHGTDELDLPTPIVAQCIGSTGFDLHFATCQLNTTRFSDNEGVKNQIWAQPNIKLLTAVRREFDLFVEDYNDSAGLALIAHSLNGLVEN